MNDLNGLIKCQECGKNYNFKNNTNNNYVYVCQTRKNYGASKCNAPIIKESFLLDIIRQHCEIQNKLFSESKVKLFVREIRIDRNEIKIFYKNGDVSEINSNGIIF